MRKLKNQKACLDGEITKYADQRVQFSLISDVLGVIDIDVALGDLMEQLVLIHMDEALKAHMTLGKIYEYDATPYTKAADSCTAYYMFKAGMDSDDENLFGLDSTVEYDQTMVYALPVECVVEWAVAEEHKPAKQVAVYKYEVPSDIDISELEELIADGADPDAMLDWLNKHATPVSGQGGQE